MYAILIFSIVVISAESKFTIYVTDTPVQKIGSRLYKQHLVTNEYRDVKELTYDSEGKNLYFMYMDDLIQNSGRACINVITKKTTKIKGIQKNKATAVDPDTGEVYFGSEDGLYRYNAVTQCAEYIGLYNMNIFKIVIRNNAMYVIDANNHMIYKIYDRGTRAVKQDIGANILEFDVDHKKNIHYVTMCGVFCAPKDKEIVKNKDLSVVYQFLLDEYKTFGVNENGLYEIDCYNGTAKHVANLDFAPRSIIFGDYGDIFYSVDDSVYRLKPINSYFLYKIHKNIL